MNKQLCVFSVSPALDSQNIYTGQYPQICEQDSKKSPQTCQGATSAAQRFDRCPVKPYGMSNYLRMSVGLPEENAAAIAAIRKVLRS